MEHSIRIFEYLNYSNSCTELKHTNVHIVLSNMKNKWKKCICIESDISNDELLAMLDGTDSD